MKTYNELVNVEDFGWKKEWFVEDRWDVSFYCKECEEIVDTERPNPQGYVFNCKKCGSENIAIWTLEWLKSNYKLK